MRRGRFLHHSPGARCMLLALAMIASTVLLAPNLVGCTETETSTAEARSAPSNRDTPQQQSSSELATSEDEQDPTENQSAPQSPISGKSTARESEIGMTSDEQAVLEAFEAMQQAMIDKDVDAMRALTTEDKTFTHMSGKTQTREQFFGEIADGTLNYFGYEIHNPHVVVEGDRATLAGSTTLDARVYGMSGSWTLPTNAHFVKQDGAWIQCN